MTDKNKTSAHRRSEKVGDRVSIYLRGKTWWINYQDADGKQVRYSLKTKSKKQAKSLAFEKENELRQGRDSSDIVIARLAEAIAAYDAHLVSLDRAPKTLSKYRRVSQRVKELADERRVKDIRGITLQFMDAYRQLRKNDGVDEETVHDELTIIKQLSNFALSRDMLDRDRLQKLDLERPTPKPQPCWSPAEVQLILETLRDDDYSPVYQLLAQSGLRIGEAKHLTWDDIDLVNRTLRVRAKVIDERTGTTWKPKTGNQRSMPLSIPLVAMLDALPRKSRWIFTSPSTLPRLAGQPVDERRVLYHLKKALKKLGLKGHLHTFRHSLISHALVSGTPATVVREWAGHLDPAILKLYTHIADADSKAYMDKLFNNTGADHGAVNTKEEMTPDMVGDHRDAAQQTAS
jgi:site-specific recombinase XerD